jgi:hypothetical protein
MGIFLPYSFHIPSTVLREFFGSSSGVLREFFGDSPSNQEGFPKDSRRTLEKSLNLYRVNVEEI